ncbi:hypothetical protein SLEP1_g20553 [Rubroshorea leprosula]|uniref:mitogen-activated protein kinase kinase kinase n=1 Tax=Rubroshorea leprosula TaxID=152421 RepID=A0AAV5JBT8_9ROSI|nr:hypothetical protein SLEP1_g20553 [Rubroshorea leprosula]
MQDFFGSVRRSLVFRTTPENPENDYSPPLPLPTPTALVEKINYCIRKSRVFTKRTSPSPPMVPPIRWRKGELIGCGAFGRVYMGMDLDSGELLAVKQVLIAAKGASKEKAQANVKELEEEVKLLQKLSHPKIVRYLGTVREDETLNILLEFVPGGSISSLLGNFGPFPESVIRTYTKQLLVGLEYLHNNGIIHRDIKGANILVDNQGCIKLADFGASKQVAELATISGAKSIKGTPYWMAPEVILQTGHTFSADMWSVGCTVIEMATGKPPWSQQYQEVAALFYIGTTKSHPPIPEHLSVEAKDFLLKCLQKEPNLRPVAAELLKHPFVSGEHEESTLVVHDQVVEDSEIPSPSHAQNQRDLQEASICNLGSLNHSTLYAEKILESKGIWRTNNGDDDMCLIDNEDFAAIEEKVGSPNMFDNISKSSLPACGLSNDWRKIDGSPIQNQEEMSHKTASCPSVCDEGKNEFSFPCGQSSLCEDDDVLTESKIKALLDEKALELKKLQTPLYEEFYNSLNVACSPRFAENTHEETHPNYLKLPPKSKSPSHGAIGSPLAMVDAVSTGSPGSSSRCVSIVDNATDQTLQENSSHQQSDWKALPVDAQQESISPSLSFSERQRKWKEELDQELERKREMMRQTGAGGKTSSPKDQALKRQRERTRFASPRK